LQDLGYILSSKLTCSLIVKAPPNPDERDKGFSQLNFLEKEQEIEL